MSEHSSKNGVESKIDLGEVKSKHIERNTIDLFTFKWELPETAKGQHSDIHIWCKPGEQKCGDGHAEEKIDNTPTPGEAVLLQVSGWPTKLYLELPLASTFQWNRSSCSTIYDEICEHLAKKGVEPITFEHTQKPLLFGYRGPDPVNYLLIDFKNQYDADICAKIFAGQFTLTDDTCSALGVARGTQCLLPVHEANFDNIIKFMAFNNLKPAQWIRVPERLVTEQQRIGQYRYELRVDYKEIVSLPNCEIRPNITVHMFDAETFSHKPRVFPKPTVLDNSIISMSNYIRRPKGKEFRDYKQVIALGERLPLLDDKGVPRTDVEIDECKNEEALIDTFYQSVLKQDCDILGTFNGTGFDNKYIRGRHETIHHKGNLPHMGRYRSELHASSPTMPRKVPSKQKMLRGEAWKMPGRISFDLKLYAKREFGTIFANVSLEALSQHFLKRGKLDIDMAEMFRLYRESVAAGLATGIGEISRTYRTDPLIFGPNATEESASARRRQLLEEWRKLDEYNLVDSELTILLFQKLNIVDSLIEYANINYVQMEDLFIRGPKYAYDCSLYYWAKRLGYVVNGRKASKEKYQGGFVDDNPVLGMNDFLVWLDVKSMYPSEIIAHNICYTTFIPPTHWGSVPPEDYNVHRFKETININPKKTGKPQLKDVWHEQRYVKKHVRIGILPQMMAYYIETRDKVKSNLAKLVEAKKRGEAVDDTEISRQDCRQGVIKVKANSGYGALGLQFEDNELSFVEGARLVTATGRESWQIMFNIAMAAPVPWTCTKVYGDTDSIVLAVQATSYTQAKERGEYLKDLVNTGLAKREQLVMAEFMQALEWLKNRQLARTGSSDEKKILVLTVENEKKMLTASSDEKKVLVVNEKDIEKAKERDVLLLVCGYDEKKGILMETKDGVVKIERGAITVELEKIVRLLMKTAKCYAYQIYMKDGTLEMKNGEPAIKLKGMAGARRNEYQWVVKSQHVNLVAMFRDEGIIEAYKRTVNAIDDLLTSKVDITDLTKTQKMGFAYKSKTATMARFSENMKAAGAPLIPGEYVTFLVADLPSMKRVGERLVPYDLYRRAPEEKRPKVDNVYYALSMLKKVDSIWQLQPKFKLNVISKVEIKGRWYSLEYPSKFLTSLIKVSKGDEYKKLAMYALAVTLGMPIALARQHYGLAAMPSSASLVASTVTTSTSNTIPHVSASQGVSQGSWRIDQSQVRRL